jgi:hypothetical protein
MNCPGCSTEMRAGTTKVAWPTLVGILEWTGAIFGDSPGSRQYLYFYPADGGESVCAFEGERSAFRCPKCQIVVISGPGLEDASHE